MKLEAGLKAALVDSVSAVQHQIRVEDPAAFGRNGRFRQYRDDHGAAQIQHELPCPTLTPQGRSVFARAESIEPYGLSTHGGLPEEALLFIVKNELEIDAVELIAYCMRNIGCLMVSVDLAGNEVRKNEFQGRWWVARPEIMWPRCGLGAGYHVGWMGANLREALGYSVGQLSHGGAPVNPAPEGFRTRAERNRSRWTSAGEGGDPQAKTSGYEGFTLHGRNMALENMMSIVACAIRLVMVQKFQSPRQIALAYADCDKMSRFVMSLDCQRG